MGSVKFFPLMRQGTTDAAVRNKRILEF
jgi:hypothetical protein